MLALGVLLVSVTAAVAAPLPQLLWQVPEDGQSGAGPGQIRGGSIAVDPVSGDVFVADGFNARIEQFDPWGQFIKTWGWGVVASGPGDKPPKNERQELDVSAVGSNYRIFFLNSGSGSSRTGLIAAGASSAAVQAALEGTEALAPGDVSVSGPAGGPYTIEFTGEFADMALLPLVAEGVTNSKASTLQDGGSFEVCIVANGDICQAGQSDGYAAGQFPDSVGVLAVDDTGHLFVRETVNGARSENDNNAQEPSLRVQKFDLDGNFLAMWGGDVNKTTGADTCTKADLEASDECGAGIPGAGPGQFRLPSIDTFGSGIAVGPEGHIFAGDVERIQEFDPSGAFVGEVAVPGEMIRRLAVDSERNLYATFYSAVLSDAGVKPGIRKLSPTGSLIRTLGAEDPEILKQISGIALGAGDSLYAAGRLSVSAGESPPPSIVKFNSAASVLIGAKDEFGASPSIQLRVGSLATSTACGIPGEDLYATYAGEGKAYLRAYGPPPDPALCPPPELAPTITDSFASSVDPNEATVKALINPRFWPDATYRVEYGSGKCSEGGCNLLTPKAKLGEKVVNSPLPSAGVFLTGLTPGTTYHYRFVAESSGGGPTVGAEHSFTTFSLPAQANIDCPNQGFRRGPAAQLPDCRAYEMVSPLDKGGADVIAQQAESEINNPGALNQSAADGEAFTYSTYRAFGDSESAPYSAQYMATRGVDGWSSHGISPPRGHLVVLAQVTLNTQFKAFSPDLCQAWVWQETDVLLAPGAVEGFPNFYRRDNCGAEAGAYHALTTVEPPHALPKTALMEFQGMSADGSHALFIAPDTLTGTPYPGPGKNLLYEAFGDGELRFVCILPNGNPVSGGCSAGTYSSDLNTSRTEAVSHAISADGSRVFWSETGQAQNQGKIYVRVNGKQTVPVSEAAEALSGQANSQYWTAAADGSRAIFTTGAESVLQGGKAGLYEFAVGSKTTTLIASGVYGVLGWSEDAKRIYFVSRNALAPGATAGRPNLYLHESGKGGPAFIATLSSADAITGLSIYFSPISNLPRSHAARVTPDGKVAVFMSSASLTGADNTDVASGQADAEVYRYDSDSGALDCISCNPTGARPAGRNIGDEERAYWAASRLPFIQSQIYPVSRAVSDSGKRVFFESFQPLLAADTNGAEDVYEWEAPGEGDCREESAAYSSRARGCVSLISSGEDPADSRILDVDPSGQNVFIATQASLLPQDPGLIDVYDARVNGGFPQPPARVPECEGEACQGPLEAPNDPTPASSSFEGAGNVAEAPTRKKKAKKAHKKRKQKKHSKAKKKQAKAHKSGRAAQ